MKYRIEYWEEHIDSYYAIVEANNIEDAIKEFLDGNVLEDKLKHKTITNDGIDSIKEIKE